MFRAVSARLRAASAAVLICVLQSAPSSDAGSIFHRRTPAPAATGAPATVIVVPQPTGSFLYTLPPANFNVPANPMPAPSPVPFAPSDPLAADVTAGVDMSFANEVASIAGDPQYLWLAGRLGGDPARVKALKDHLRVVLLHEMKRQNGRVQSVNWPKVLENAAIVFLKLTYAFNASNPWEPALAIIQRLISDILREEGLLKPQSPDAPPPPAPPAPPSNDPASHSTRARIVGTIELEILDPIPGPTPAPTPTPAPAPAPAPVPAPEPAPKPTPTPDALPEPLPQNDDAAPPPPTTP